MATYHINIKNGSNGNNGLTPETAFKNIGKFASICGNDDVGVVYEGVYFEGDIDFRGYDRNSIRGVGDVIIDASGSESVFYNMDYGNIENITVRNFHYIFLYGGHYYAKNCIFKQTGSYYQTGEITNDRWEVVDAINCIFYGLYVAGYSYSSGVDRFTDCILINNVNNYSPYCTNCAGDQSDVYDDVNCINTATFPPPFTDISVPEFPDLRMDRTHAQYQKYSTGGANGGMIGATGRPNYGWAPNYNGQTPFYSLGSNDYRGSGVWQNDEGYYSTSWENIVISSANNKIYFEDGGSELTAPLTAGTYYTGESLAAEVSARMNDQTSDSITVTFMSNKRLSLSSGGASFSLLCNTGTNTDHAWAILGFDQSADKTGETSYESDHALVEGASAGAEPNATATVYNESSYGIELSLGLEVAATNGRCLSPVLDYGSPKIITGIGINSVEDGAGGVDAAQASSTRYVEVRGHNLLFAWDDPDGSTTQDWVMVEYYMKDLSAVLTKKYRYWQIRCVLRNNKTV